MYLLTKKARLPLPDKTRKEFEKWALLTYTNNKTMVNEKRGRDRGIDGQILILDKNRQYKEIYFSVKSNKIVLPAMIRDLRGVVERESAAGGVFITLTSPTKEMKTEAVKAGTYQNEYMAKPMPRIKIVTIDEILAGEHFDVPLVTEVVKKAQATNLEQDDLF